MKKAFGLSFKKAFKSMKANTRLQYSIILLTNVKLQLDFLTKCNSNKRCI
jgi:hypothetical protein